MTEGQAYDIIVSGGWLWTIPKKPSCLTDEVIIMIAENPEWALRAVKQIRINDNEDFWRSVYTRGKKTKSKKSKKWRLIGFSKNKKKD